jgi:hypothetical protein
MRFALRALPALALLAACGPTNGSLDGGGGGSACAPLKSPPNLLVNPGFDCAGKETEWGAVYGDYALVSGGRSGNAGQVTVTNAIGGRFGPVNPVATASKATTYCATAWMKGTAPFANLKLFRETDTNPPQFSSPIDAAWIRLPPSLVLSETAPAGEKVYVLFATDNRAHLGDTLIVDDVDVWESASGKCDESRAPVSQ